MRITDEGDAVPDALIPSVLLTTLYVVCKITGRIYFYSQIKLIYFVEDTATPVSKCAIIFRLLSNLYSKWYLMEHHLHNILPRVISSIYPKLKINSIW
jgi:hypothetical protein